MKALSHFFKNIVLRIKNLDTLTTGHTASINTINTTLSDIRSSNQYITPSAKTISAGGGYATMHTITIPADGVYLVTANLAFNGSGTNSGTGQRWGAITTSSSGTSGSIDCSDQANAVAVGGYVTYLKMITIYDRRGTSSTATRYLRAWHNCSVAQTVNATINIFRLA